MSYRLKAFKKTGKRTYRLELITDLRPYVKKGTKYLLERLTVGLKEHEKKVLLKYLNDGGSYILPLEFGKEYSWKEVKKELSSHITRKTANPPLEVLDEIQRRRKKAWKIINKRFSNKDKLDLSKLGYVLQLYP